MATLVIPCSSVDLAPSKNTYLYDLWAQGDQPLAPKSARASLSTAIVRLAPR
jgi:hypothetical protein